MAAAGSASAKQKSAPAGGAAPKAAAVPKSSQAAAAPKAGGAAPKGSAKAKAKAVPEKPPGPSPPEEPDAQADANDPEAAKKKKNRRGGQKKKVAGDGEEAPEEIPKMVMPKGTDEAEKVAEKDPDLLVLRARLGDVEKSIASRIGTAREHTAMIDGIMSDIDKQLVAKRVSPPRGARQPSEMLAQSLHELQASQGESDMLEQVKRQLDEAKAFEVYSAIKMKMGSLKARCEEVQKGLTGFKGMSGAAAVVLGNKSSTTGRGAAGGGGGSAARDEQRDALFLRRLAVMHDLNPEGMTDTKLFQKTIEISPEVTKHLFAPPASISSRFEREYGVVIDPVRSPKGGGKGGKGESGKPQPPKDLIVAGLTQAEVDRCCDMLSQLDFSGTQTKEVNVGSSALSYGATKALEQEFGVVVVKSRNAMTLYGPKASVEAAFAKAEAAKAAEDAQVTIALSVDADKAKALQNQLAGWRLATGASIRVTQGTEDDSKKVLIVGKGQAEADAGKKKVEEYIATIASHFVKAEESAIAKLYGATFNRKFRELCENSNADIVRKTGGLQVLAPRADIGTAKAELQDLLKKACFEPVLHPLRPEQARIFGRENLLAVSKSSGADVRRQGRDADFCLVITGDEEQVEKAKSEIEEMIQREGTVVVIPVSEDAIKSLLVGGGSRLRDLENRLSVSISLDKDAQQATVVGSGANTQAAKTRLTSYAKQVDKEIAETVTKELTVDSSYIPRIIGSKGATLRDIRGKCGVQVTIDDENCIVKIKGPEEGVASAADMIDRIMNADQQQSPQTAAPKAKAASSPPRRKVQVEEFKSGEADFPTLGGEAAGKQTKAAGAWGKVAARKEAESAPPPVAEAAPTPAEAAGKVAAATAATAATGAGTAVAMTQKEADEGEDEEAAGDMDDPFALMGGMGEEEVYKVTCMQEEENAGDDVEDVDDDPFAMMGGMGAEEVYKVTLMDDKTEEAKDNDPDDDKKDDDEDAKDYAEGDKDEEEEEEEQEEEEEEQDDREDEAEEGEKDQEDEEAAEAAPASKVPMEETPAPQAAAPPQPSAAPSAPAAKKSGQAPAFQADDFPALGGEDFPALGSSKAKAPRAWGKPAAKSAPATAPAKEHVPNEE